MPTVIVLDIETHYAKDYTLSKLTTEAYVRDPRYETIGISIAIADKPPVWIPKPKVRKVLERIDWSDAMVVCQNTMFDGAILKWHYGVEPLAWLDIMGMSRALFPHEKSHSLAAQAERMGIGQKGTEVLNSLGKRYADFTPEELARYGAYCDNDVHLTRELFKRYMRMGFPKQELKLIDMTLRMFIDAQLELDAPLLQTHLADVVERKERLLDRVQDLLSDGGVEVVGDDGVKRAIMSNDRFANLLRVFDVEPPTKISPTTGKEAYAFAKTDEAFLELQEHPREEVQALVACRLGNRSTIEETRTERFIDMATRGAFPVPLRYYGAHSGRWSGLDSVNLQNLPARGIGANRIKQSIRAPEGYMLIDCDSSQIEARTLAWLAGQTDLVEAFRRNNEEKLAGVPAEEQQHDVYKLMATKVYGVPMHKVDKPKRQVGKTVILGAGYGVGHQKLQAFLKTQAGVLVDLPEAKRIIDVYRQSNLFIVKLWRSADTALRSMLMGNASIVDAQGLTTAIPGVGLTLPSGLHIQYPGLEMTSEGMQYYSKGKPIRIYSGKVVENLCQAVARCIVAEQALRIQRRYPVKLMVHDSVVALVPEHEVEEAQAFIEACMRWVPTWAPGLPLACEASVGKTYGG